MLETVAKTFLRVVPACDFWTLRVVSRSRERVAVRQGIPEPLYHQHCRGVHITLHNRGGSGYAATSDVTEAGLKNAAERALAWAETSSTYALFDASALPRIGVKGRYQSTVEEPWSSRPLADKIALLQQLNTQLKADASIVDWSASLVHQHSKILFVSPNAETFQEFSYLIPGLTAVAHRHGETVQRSFGHGNGAQAGLEYLRQIDLPSQADRVAEEVRQLSAAANCPSGRKDLMLMPEQMMLQIHESIGHPLELDRILGDERNYAGASFVTTEMFGNYQYGSELLNVTFDPTVPGQLASCAFDDDGAPAKREYLIRDGVLLRPLGGVCSQYRAGMSGVANARACHWNRPAIDRMTNINLEPSTSSVPELIASLEDGILMETNLSWSIDDSRNKFQFGCEYGRIIKDGTLREVVKNPNYRGISATFWRSLTGVGDKPSFAVLGTPHCGKGEPNQAIHVGHAAAPCTFSNVEVFGGRAVM